MGIQVKHPFLSFNADKSSYWINLLESQRTHESLSDPSGEITLMSDTGEVSKTQLSPSNPHKTQASVFSAQSNVLSAVASGRMLRCNTVLHQRASVCSV